MARAKNKKNWRYEARISNFHKLQARKGVTPSDSFSEATLKELAIALPENLKPEARKALYAEFFDACNECLWLYEHNKSRPKRASIRKALSLACDYAQKNEIIMPDLDSATLGLINNYIILFRMQFDRHPSPMIPKEHYSIFATNQEARAFVLSKYQESYMKNKAEKGGRPQDDHKLRFANHIAQALGSFGIKPTGGHDHKYDLSATGKHKCGVFEKVLKILFKAMDLEVRGTTRLMNYALKQIKI